MDLNARLARRGLDRRTRLLALSQAAIWPGEWDALDAVFACARADGLPRADFEEALLQATLFFGFPRLVSAFERLQAVWPAAAPPTGGSVPADRQREAGRELFAAIYGKNDAAVRGLLASFHREFHDFVLEAAYGRILARPGLDARTRELMATAALAALRQVPQLVAHGRGALTFGATAEAVREAILCGIDDEPLAEQWLRRIRPAS